MQPQELFVPTLAHPYRARRRAETAFTESFAAIKWHYSTAKRELINATCQMCNIQGA
jgi:hypothetical protein